MNGIELLLVAGAAAVGALVGVHLQGLAARVRFRRLCPKKVLREQVPIEPLLATRVRDASRAWADRTGRHDAEHLAAGYIEDAARMTQDRWQDWP